jgi:glycosyltransferase involved in cell wall biosynthesis
LRDIEARPPATAVPVLLTVRELGHGGIERDVTKVALGLDRSRLEPHVVAYQDQGMRLDELRSAGVPFLHLPVTSLISPSAIAAGYRLWRYIREHRIRLVHAWDTSAAFAVPLARLARVPVVISSQLGHRSLSDPNTKRLVRLTDRLVDAIVVNCEAMRRHLIEDESVPAGRIELCYNGVDTTQFYPAQASRPEALANASLVIGTVCVLRPEKALDVLQEAFARMRHVQPGTVLLIVGSGPELPRLEDNARRLGIAEASVFVPATRDVPGFLRAIDIFVLCSHSEAFSNALLEAMACGCASIGTRVGGTPELTGDDERGLLCRPGDPADLAEKLTTLVGDAGLRRRFGTVAARFVKENLSIDVAVQRTSEIYEGLLRRKTGVVA